MKKLLLVPIMSLCLLTSCVKTPDNIDNNNHKVNSTTQNSYVSVEHILDDFDEAYEQEYTKFSLPEKTSVIINQPDDICDLELRYVNNDKSMEWIKEKVYKLADIFNVPSDENMKMIENFSCAIETSKEEVCAILFSEPYYCLKCDFDPNEFVCKKN